MPEVDDGVKTQLCADPVLEKSDAEIPETDSVNDIPKVNETPGAGVFGVDVTDAPGGSTPIVIALEFLETLGPTWVVVGDVTASCATVRMTVPDVTLAPVRPTTYELPEPLNDVIDHPVLVPDKVISDCVRPVTDSLNTRLYVSVDCALDGDETVAAKLETSGFSIVRTTSPLPERLP